MSEMRSSARLQSMDRFVVPALIGFAPLLILVLTWDRGGVTAFAPRMLREYAVPIIAAEGIVIGLAMMNGMNRWLVRTRPPTLILLCLLLWIVIAFGTALFAAPFPPFSIFLTILWVVHAVFGLSVAFLVRKRVVDEKQLLAFMMVGFCLYAILLALFPLQVENPERFSWLTRMPGLGQLRRSGYYGTVILGLCVGAFAVRRTRLALPVLTCIVGVFLVVWSGARAPIPAVLAATVLGWLLFPGMRQARGLVLLALAAVVGTAMALALPIPTGEAQTVTSQTRTMPGQFVGPTRILANQTTSGRTDFWLAIGREIQARPWFGHGEGQTAFVLRRNWVANAHNLPLQLLFAWGLVGTFCVAVVGLWVGRFIVVETRRRGEMMLPYVLGATALLAQSAVDGTIYDVASTSFFAACIGAAAGLALRGLQPEARPSPRPAPD